MCFDKTGTLTLNTVKVHKILKFVNEVTVQDITLERDDRAHELIFKLFASCHTAKNIEGELLGD